MSRTKPVCGWAGRPLDRGPDESLAEVEMAATEKGPFNRALDGAVARHVADQVARNCPACLGTKTVYVAQGDGSNKRVPCRRCDPVQ